jgi:hypothetical protein
MANSDNEKNRDWERGVEMPVYYELDVTLRHIKPKIWRRFHLPPEATFEDLSDAIQFCGPWDGSHLWQFSGWGRDGEVFAHISGEGGFNPAGIEPIPSAAEVRLSDILKKKGDRCLYEYDFGDGWEHEVKLRRIIEIDETFTRRLVDGERNFPQEDSGGVHGYHMNLLALGRIEYDGPEQYRPRPAALKERREWIGNWDPDAFDLDKLKTEFDHPPSPTPKTPPGRKK